MKINKMKIISYAGIIALLASMIVGLLGFSYTTREIDNIKNEFLRKHLESNINLSMKYMGNYYGTLTQGDGTLLDSEGNSIEGRYGVVDIVLEDLGNKSSIFVKVDDDFKRISTNIMSDENERAVGTYLGKDHNAYKTVMSGRIYVGGADILGESYYTAYRPIKDKNNNVIGLLFVGTPSKALDNITNIHDQSMSKINILIIILRSISLGSLIILASASIKNKESDI